MSRNSYSMFHIFRLPNPIMFGRAFFRMRSTAKSEILCRDTLGSPQALYRDLQKNGSAFNSTPKHSARQIRRLWKILKTMVSRAGLEPATTALKVRCSTN